jgi:hypothetical protein
MYTSFIWTNLFFFCKQQSFRHEGKRWHNGGTKYKSTASRGSSDVSLTLNGNDLYPHHTDIQCDVQITVLPPQLQVNTDLCHNMNMASVLTDECRLSGVWIVNILKTLMITDDNSQHLKYSVPFHITNALGKNESMIFLLHFDVLSLSITQGQKHRHSRRSSNTTPPQTTRRVHLRNPV